MVIPCVLVVDDDPEVARAHADLLAELGARAIVETDPTRVEQRLEEHGDVGLVLVDLRMPARNGLEVLLAVKLNRPSVGVVLATVVSDLERGIEAIKAGAWNYLTKPLTRDRLGEVLAGYFGSPARTSTLDPEFARFVTACPAFSELFRRVRVYAEADVPVLVQGETGTGKELVAEAIHSVSRRRGHPFTAVNVLGLAPSLFESELFGHRQGAFTGANLDHPGWIGAAGAGTLFLDEIGELPAEQQGKLLRLLQTGQYCRVGETALRPLAARLVFATNRDLERETREGRFRQDLYFRLAQHRVTLPPLRERPGDVDVLAAHFVRRYACQFGRKIDGVHEDALRALRRYAFPGNVRELEGMLRDAVLLETAHQVRADSLPEWLRTVESGPQSQDLESVRRRTILATLAECGGNQSHAAQRLGISRVTLNRLLKQFREQTGSA